MSNNRKIMVGLILLLSLYLLVVPKVPLLSTPATTYTTRSVAVADQPNRGNDWYTKEVRTVRERKGSDDAFFAIRGFATDYSRMEWFAPANFGVVDNQFVGTNPIVRPTANFMLERIDGNTGEVVEEATVTTGITQAAWESMRNEDEWNISLEWDRSAPMNTFGTNVDQDHIDDMTIGNRFFMQ